MLKFEFDDLFPQTNGIRIKFEIEFKYIQFQIELLLYTLISI